MIDDGPENQEQVGWELWVYYYYDLGVATQSLRRHRRSSLLEQQQFKPSRVSAISLTTQIPRLSLPVWACF